LEIIKFVNNLPNKRAFWSIGDQLLRAITSIGANMIEAKSSSSKREFIKFYEIALKSANEAKYWLAMLKELSTEIKKKQEIDIFFKELDEISKIFGSSVLTLKGKKGNI